MRTVGLREDEGIDSSQGLTAREAEKRLIKNGYNELIKKKKISPIGIFLSQFNDFITWILVAATVISGFMGEKADAVTIIIIILINAALGFIQEYKTERSLEALSELAAPTAKVLRDGRVMVIKAREIVVGDIVELEAGDRIPADCVLVRGEGVFCDESILTGESVPVEKRNLSIKGFPQNENMMFMGCSLSRGRGAARIIATGMNTEMGKIAGMLEEIETGKTPLQQKLAKLGEILVYGCIGVCGIVTITGILRGEDAYRMFLIGVSLAVAAIPEGLPAIVTVSLAFGVQRMMRKNALVRKLPAVETLGCTKVICSDKTGTLTQNKMTVKKIYIVDGYGEVSGDGYNIKGDITFRGSRANIRSNRNLRMLLEGSVICNNAEMPEEEKKLKISGKEKLQYSGDPTEIALVVMAAKAGIQKGEVLRRYRIQKENPFDSDRKMMSVLCYGDGRQYLFVKGAPEKITGRCTGFLKDGEIKPLTRDVALRITEANNKMAGEALRVLGVAYKEVNSENSGTGEDNLIFLGLAGMIDPPREEVRDAVMECKLAGITPVMITGDHKLTAQAIARELRILNENEMVITGEELDRMSDSVFEKTIDRIRVFARVSPSHKYRIVKTLKKRGMVVAMTGDGVNDAPAIKEADIGVAMGITGTDVTKEASSMILLDDNFATIVAAVREGRVIYDNIRKFLRYLLSCNIGEVLTMFLSSILSLPIPLIPIQILLVNLATDGLPAMALSMEPGEKDVMSRRPREKNESIFSEGLWAKIVLRGILIGLCTIVAFSMTLVYFEGNLRLARTVALATLVMSQLFHVFECRSERHSVFKLGFLTNIWLIFAVLSSTLMLILIIYNPWLQGIFSTMGLNLIQWVIVLLFSGSISLISSLVWYR